MCKYAYAPEVYDSTIEVTTHKRYDTDNDIRQRIAYFGYGQYHVINDSVKFENVEDPDKSLDVALVHELSVIPTDSNQYNGDAIEIETLLGVAIHELELCRMSRHERTAHKQMKKALKSLIKARRSGDRHAKKSKVMWPWTTFKNFLSW